MACHMAIRRSTLVWWRKLRERKKREKIRDGGRFSDRNEWLWTGEERSAQYRIKCRPVDVSHVPRPIRAVGTRNVVVDRVVRRLEAGAGAGCRGHGLEPVGLSENGVLCSIESIVSPSPSVFR